MAKRISLTKLIPAHFAKYGEFVVAFELLKRGWNAYMPIYDKKIDLVAHRIENGKSEFRTIQVRSSRIVDEGKNFGFKIYPEDLINDPRHFFIIYCAHKKGMPKFLVMSVKDFKKIMGNSLQTASFKNRRYRHHINIKTFKEGKKDWSKFLNKFGKLG